MFFSFIHVKVHGEENLPKFPDSPAIIVMNHSSALDIFLMEIIVKRYPHIWLTKEEYTKIPFFSVLLKRMHVPVKRENEMKAARAMVKAINRAKEISSHILLFPEGTRSRDGNMQKFHSGFAVLAKKLNRPVIPIKTTGLHAIFPKGTIFIDYHASQPTATIGKPIYMKPDESTQEFSNRVESWFNQ